MRARVAESLATLRIAALAERPTHSLSFGQKKRVAIAGVLAMRPAALIARIQSSRNASVKRSILKIHPETRPQGTHHREEPAMTGNQQPEHDQDHVHEHQHEHAHEHEHPGSGSHTIRTPIPMSTRTRMKTPSHTQTRVIMAPTTMTTPVSTVHTTTRTETVAVRPRAAGARGVATFRRSKTLYASALFCHRN